MKKNKKTLVTVVTTALVTCLLTNTYRDIKFLNENGKIVYKVSTIAKILDEYSMFEYDEEKVADYAAMGMTGAIDDDYTVYYPSDYFAKYKTHLANSFCGIGITLTTDIDKNMLLVSDVIKNSPADKAGMLSGDYIILVDDVEFSGEQLHEASETISGGKTQEVKGTVVKVTVDRNGERIDCYVTRDEVLLDSVKEKMIPQTKIGYINITAFNMAEENSQSAIDTHDEFKQSLEILRKDGMEKLIIDMRNNPGGSLSVVNKIADELLPKGIITYTMDKKGKRVDYTSEDGELNIPIVVLVNSKSASAAEVLTGALKDHKKATVIGEKTYGKGIVQTVFPLNDGSGMSVTTSKYYSPNGECIHGIGIEPDIVVEMDSTLNLDELSYDEDIQLKKAVEHLSNN